MSFPTGIPRRVRRPGVQNTFKSTGIDFACEGTCSLASRRASRSFDLCGYVSTVHTNQPPVTTPTLPVSRLNSNSSGCFYKTPFSITVHTHISNMANPRLQWNATQFGDARGSVVQGAWGVGADQRRGRDVHHYCCHRRPQLLPN